MAENGKYSLEMWLSLDEELIQHAQQHMKEDIVIGTKSQLLYCSSTCSSRYLKNEQIKNTITCYSSSNIAEVELNIEEKKRDRD